MYRGPERSLARVQWPLFHSLTRSLASSIQHTLIVELTQTFAYMYIYFIVIIIIIFFYKCILNRGNNSSRSRMTHNTRPKYIQVALTL